MKKVWSIIIGVLLLVNLLGCQPTEEPTPIPPTESPQTVAEYPYNELEKEDIKGIEVSKEGERTPLIEDSEELLEVAQLIQNAKFVKNADISQSMESRWQMTIYLNRQIIDSNRVTLHYVEDKNTLYIGPEGREYIIQSQELEEFIKEYPKGKIVIVEEKVIQKEAKEWFSPFLQEKGAYIYQHPDATYVKIVAGKKPTGGYDIYLREFKDVEYPEEIIIELKEPQPHESVTEAITFPTIYLKIKSEKASQYEVKTIDGEVYETENKLIFAKLEEPEDNAKIDNPVRVKGKIIAFEGAFVVRILEEGGNLLHEENLQADYGGPNWGDFDEEISFPQPTKEKGSIELGEYSAKDGTYQLREKMEIRFK